MKTQIYNQITVDPKVRFGKPIIAGTRIPVDLILGKIAGGMTFKEIGQEYDLTHEQVMSTLKYAADLVSSEEISFI